MTRILIVARIKAGTEADVARVFAASDATSLPTEIGVRRRELYSLNDLYVHVVEFDTDAATAMDRAQSLQAFHDVSEALRPYISPYDPQWRSPRDAVARPFYGWHASA